MFTYMPSKDQNLGGTLGDTAIAEPCESWSYI